MAAVKKRCNGDDRGQFCCETLAGKSGKANLHEVKFLKELLPFFPANNPADLGKVGQRSTIMISPFLLDTWSDCLALNKISSPI